jgi:hypothetical protein
VGGHRTTNRVIAVALLDIAGTVGGAREVAVTIPSLRAEAIRGGVELTRATDHAERTPCIGEKEAIPVMVSIITENTAVVVVEDRLSADEEVRGGEEELTDTTDQAVGTPSEGIIDTSALGGEVVITDQAVANVVIEDLDTIDLNKGMNH